MEQYINFQLFEMKEMMEISLNFGSVIHGKIIDFRIIDQIHEYMHFIYFLCVIHQIKQNNFLLSLKNNSAEHDYY